MCLGHIWKGTNVRQPLKEFQLAEIQCWSEEEEGFYHARHIWSERRRSPWVVCESFKNWNDWIQHCLLSVLRAFCAAPQTSLLTVTELSSQTVSKWPELMHFYLQLFFLYVKFKEEGKHTCGGVDGVCSSHSSATSCSVSTAGRLSDRSATDNSVQSPIISIACNKDLSRAQTWRQKWSVPVIPRLPDIWDSWREINQVVTDLNQSSKLSQSWETRAAEKRQSKHTNVSWISGGEDDLTENLFKVDSITLFSCIKCTSKVTTEEKCSVDKNDGKIYSEGRKT